MLKKTGFFEKTPPQKIFFYNKNLRKGKFFGGKTRVR